MRGFVLVLPQTVVCDGYATRESHALGPQTHRSKAFAERIAGEGCGIATSPTSQTGTVRKDVKHPWSRALVVDLPDGYEGKERDAVRLLVRRVGWGCGSWRAS